MSLNNLREISFLTWIVERVFFAFSKMSVVNLLYLSRIEDQTHFYSPSINIQRTRRRSWQVEKYIVICLVIELALTYFAPSSRGVIKAICIILPVYRIFDVTQIAVNLSIFDRLRRTTRYPHYVASMTRTVVLSFWNFFELIVCFGILYSIDKSMLHGAKFAWDAYYFSAITQLTIGFGDIYPCPGSWGRILAPLQGCLGFVFALLVLSRLIALLPAIESILPTERQPRI